MPKPSKKEILEAMKDPTLLKEAGLQPIEDELEKELFADIVVGENDTMEDLVKKINGKTRKQKEYYRKREEKILNSAEEKASAGERARKDREVNSFLESHPELSNNKKLLDIVDRLYQSGDKLEDAWKAGCKVLDLDPDTGLTPSSGDDDKDKDNGGKKPDEKKDTKDKKEVISPLKSDTIDSGLPGQKTSDDDDGPKSIRELAGEISNDLAANGKNPFRDS
jgi:hypothetical protein